MATIYDRIMSQSVNLVDQLLEDSEKAELRHTPQPESEASYYSSVCEDDFRLDWWLKNFDAGFKCRRVSAFITFQAAVSS